MNVRIFETVNFCNCSAQVVYIDDSSAQLKIDDQIIWISREDLEALYQAPLSPPKPLLDFCKDEPPSNLP